jgi:hypothetical protein
LNMADSIPQSFELLGVRYATTQELVLNGPFIIYLYLGRARVR